MDDTTDPGLRSFVPVAPDSHFPIQNLPFGVFRPRSAGPPRIGVAIGEQVLDLAALEAGGCFDGPALAGRQVFGQPRLNAFLALGRPAWREARARISRLLGADEPELRDDRALRERVLFDRSAVELVLPVEVGDYTDFYASREHATNVGAMFRGRDNALMPNWLHLPVAYHGRASSIVVSGTDIRRPAGQIKLDEETRPIFAPSRCLDFELEMGVFFGPGNELGVPIPIDEAIDHVFGLVLVNDWSARDIQRWEYQPLGPFLAKNFATSISPWVVPLDALEPFRTAGPAQDPEPLPYLRGAAERSGARAYDIHLEVWLGSERTPGAHRLCASNFRHLYWSIAQQVAHHTASGCNLRPGDLLASGTISGPEPSERGCLLELAWQGQHPVALPGGETRAWLEDGDRVTMTGWCQGEGYRVGFGEVTGRVLPAVASPGS